MTQTTNTQAVQDATVTDQEQPVPVPPEVEELLQPLADAYLWHRLLTTASDDAADNVHRLARALTEARQASAFYSRLAGDQERAIGLRLHMLDAGVRAAGLPGRPPLPQPNTPQHSLPTPPPYSDPLTDPLSAEHDDEADHV